MFFVVVALFTISISQHYLLKYWNRPILVIIFVLRKSASAEAGHFQRTRMCVYVSERAWEVNWVKWSKSMWSFLCTPSHLGVLFPSLLDPLFLASSQAITFFLSSFPLIPPHCLRTSQPFPLAWPARVCQVPSNRLLVADKYYRTGKLSPLLLCFTSEIFFLLSFLLLPVSSKANIIYWLIKW